MPIYIALYRTLYSAVDLYRAPLYDGLAWVTDLAAPDEYFILPLLLGVVFGIQQKMSAYPWLREAIGTDRDGESCR